MAKNQKQHLHSISLLPVQVFLHVMDTFFYPSHSCTFEKQRTHQGKSSGSSSSIKPSVLCVDPHRGEIDIKSHSKLCLLSVNISSCKKHCHGIVQSCINSCNFCPTFWSLQLASRLLNCSLVKGRFKNFMHRHGMWCKLSCTWHLTHE